MDGLNSAEYSETWLVHHVNDERVLLFDEIGGEIEVKRSMLPNVKKGDRGIQDLRLQTT
ncbi:MAG: hypothetical protein H6779_05365 [Candidatus Nomurabacteria bacterium]|nr:MAG: hypothetical protein H6779_05365 [Candidatus Nomurabacteria bacterium]